MPEKTAPGLWDRSRRQAYAEITGVAVDLFLAQGFDETTIDQIAAASGISRRSFFRYFGTKEDILLGDISRQGPELAAALAARPADEGPWDALRAALGTLRGFGRSPAETLALSKMLHETPSLRARSVEKHRQWQELLVPDIRARLGVQDDDLDPCAPAIVACALTCLDVAGELWSRSDGRLDLVDLWDRAVAAIRS